MDRTGTGAPARIVPQVMPRSSAPAAVLGVIAHRTVSTTVSSGEVVSSFPSNV